MDIQITYIYINIPISAYRYTQVCDIEYMDWKNKIKNKYLGEAPNEISTNIQSTQYSIPQGEIVKNPSLEKIKQLEEEITKLKDQRYTGRTRQIGLKVKESFYVQVKQLASEENCYLVEILEKALELYIQQKEK